MTPSPEKPNAAGVLRTLKTFQRDTVDYVYARMYEDARPARRFLVADEVGLGKTLVARGVIARAVEHLWDRVGRIDIVYICSNSGIARQNINRVNVTGLCDHQLPDRITLLPRDVKNLRHKKLNFVSFTPGTSFNLRSSMGVAEERALLYWLIPESWRDGSAAQGAISLLCGGADRGRFADRVSEFQRFYNIDEELQGSFRRRLETTIGIEQRFGQLASELGRRSVFTDEENARRATIIGELRQLLARVCMNALEPDLIILDEFQRFKDLLHGNDFSAELARALFDYEASDGSANSRVLLLSATPYKMYTLHDEAGLGEQHLNDFLDTVRFLFDDDTRTQQFSEILKDYSRELWRARSGAQSELRELRDHMQQMLCQVMVRTERLAVTPDRNGMLAEVPPRVKLHPEDLPSYIAMQRVASLVSHGDTIEYWKSAPYALNFMEEYQFKEHFRGAIASGSAPLYSALERVSSVLLRRSDIESYARLDPANARLRWLLDETIGKGAASQLWLPPSCPYYTPQGAFDKANGLTKFLVFSAWQVVPKVVASLLSYEAERQLLRVDASGEAGGNTPAARRRRRGRLRFTRSQGRLTGMPVLALVYPSLSLAELGDPLRAVRSLRQAGEPPLALQNVFDWAKGRASDALDALVPSDTSGGPSDQRWYWAAPVLLDLARHEEQTRRWFGQANLAAVWQTAAAEGEALIGHVDDGPDDVDRWADHVDEARRLLEGPDVLGLGQPPEDLASVLASLAVGGPANNALRAVLRVTGEAGEHDVSVRNSAGQIAHGLRSLFNQPEVVGWLQRGEDDEVYWRRVLEYAADGCLSAVLDEYAHVALEADSLAGKPVHEMAVGLATRMTTALTLQTATLRADHIVVDSETRSVRLEEPLGFRTAFAVRYGARGDEGVAADRNQKLQTAFNSPFWPFVLCTTSVGQEGLDFHSYCHAVVHWNLPSNPVDLEQREGRVHRYKGHAVRKNVAAAHCDAAFESDELTDPWASMFKAARDGAMSDDDLVPYWIYTVDGGAQIQRHVPALPLSRDSARKHALQQALAVYRMAFGQSRQEDLVAFLAASVSETERERLAAAATIDLSPPRSARRRESGVDPTIDREIAQASALAAPAATAIVRVGLDALGRLLDEFARLRGGATGSTEPRPVGSVASFSALLDAFRAISTEGEGPVDPHRTSVGRIRTLLDCYAAIRPTAIERADPLPRFRNLLDLYAAMYERQGV